MLNTFDHPGLLFALAILLLPAVFPIRRFFFDDFETFKQEAIREYQQNRLLWLLGTPRIRFSLDNAFLALSLVTLCSCWPYISLSVVFCSSARTFSKASIEQDVWNAANVVSCAEPTQMTGAAK